MATLSGLVLIALLTGAVYWARRALDSAGYPISDGVFLVTLYAALGGGGGGFASKFILRLAKREKDGARPRQKL